MVSDRLFWYDLATEMKPSSCKMRMCVVRLPSVVWRARRAVLVNDKLRRGRKRGHDREPPLLMDDAVELEEQVRVHAAGFFFSVK